MSAIKSASRSSSTCASHTYSSPPLRQPRASSSSSCRLARPTLANPPRLHPAFALVWTIMWVPRDAAEIEAAAIAGRLEETPSFDAKADLPSPKKNSDLAVDVANVDRGNPIYRRARVRVGQRSGARLRRRDCAAVGEGATPSDCLGRSALLRAGAKGNRRLTEGDVARLYQRRQQWDQDRDALLRQAVDQSPFLPQEKLAYLHGFARPVVPDRAIWERAANAAGDRGALQQLLVEAAGSTKPRGGYDPDLKSAVNWRRRGADEWLMSSRVDRDDNDMRAARKVVDVRINIDGRGHLFCGRAGEVIGGTNEEQRPMLLFESIIAGTSHRSWP